MRLLGSPMHGCMSCGYAFLVRRFPQHWLLYFFNGELCDTDATHLYCSSACALARQKLLNEKLKAEGGNDDRRFIYESFLP